MAGKERDWDALVVALNELHSVVQRKPRSKKIGFALNPGGILNAYREGDLTFNQAVKHLVRWAQLYASDK